MALSRQQGFTLLFLSFQLAIIVIMWDPNSPVYASLVPNFVLKRYPWLINTNGQTKNPVFDTLDPASCPFFKKATTGRLTPFKVLRTFNKAVGPLPAGHPSILRSFRDIIKTAVYGAPRAGQEYKWDLDSGPVDFFYGGNIWLNDPDDPTATARCVLSIDFHIFNVSSSDAECLDLRAHLEAKQTAPPRPVDEDEEPRRPNTVTLIDLAEGFVVPGLIDPHVHMINGGLSLTRVALGGVKTKEDFVERVAGAAASLPEGSWLVGGGWDQTGWGGDEPEATWFDGATDHVNVYLTRMCGHAAVVNRRALSTLKITAATQDPDKGEIVRDARGNPTGLLREKAILLVSTKLPAPSLVQRRDAFLAAQKHAVSRGLTAVHDMGAPAPFVGDKAAWDDLIEMMLPLALRGYFNLRISAGLPLARHAELATLVNGRAPGFRGKTYGYTTDDRMLHWGWLKEFYDGALGSHTALFAENYTDSPGTAGVRTVDAAAFAKSLQKITQDGAFFPQFMTHAIGDLAVDEVVETYSKVEGGDAQLEGQPWQRIEHVQHISGPDVAAKMAKHGMVAVINPLHYLSDKPVMAKRLGEERASPDRAFAWRVLADHGVSLACGSDWPVVPLDPLQSIHAAIYREAGFPEGEWSGNEEGRPRQGAPGALTPLEALRCHTSGAARAMGLEDTVGRVARYFWADLTVLSFDPRDPSRAGELPRVLGTVVGGRCRYGCSEGASLASGATVVVARGEGDKEGVARAVGE